MGGGLPEYNAHLPSQFSYTARQYFTIAVNESRGSWHPWAVGIKILDKESGDDNISRRKRNGRGEGNMHRPRHFLQGEHHVKMCKPFFRAAFRCGVTFSDGEEEGGRLVLGHSKESPSMRAWVEQRDRKWVEDMEEDVPWFSLHTFTRERGLD